MRKYRLKQQDNDLPIGTIFNEVLDGVLVYNRPDGSSRIHDTNLLDLINPRSKEEQKKEWSDMFEEVL